MISYANHEPRVHESVFIADSAAVIGDVEIGEGSSVWFGAVIRSDNNIIRIGKNVNVQDGVIIHEDLEDEVHIGDNVSIGHRAIIHGCTIGSNVMIGILHRMHVGNLHLVIEVDNGKPRSMTEVTAPHARQTFIGLTRHNYAHLCSFF